MTEEPKDPKAAADKPKDTSNDDKPKDENVASSTVAVGSPHRAARVMQKNSLAAMARYSRSVLWAWTVEWPWSEMKKMSKASRIG